MSNNSVYYNAGWGDEKYTPARGVEIILPHIQHLKNKIIWCPFDKAHSEFVQVLRRNGFSVVHSHIDDGQDFFTYEPEHWDAIISNPPYKGKRKFWERCLQLGKPFALLLPVNILSDSFINVTMDDRELQLLIPDKRMRFLDGTTGQVGGAPTFKAAYFGTGIFPKNIILTKL